MQATYNGNQFDPADAKVCELFGMTFFQGTPVDISGLSDEIRMRLSNNPHFTVTGVADVPKRRGRPPKASGTDAHDEGEGA